MGGFYLGFEPFSDLTMMSTLRHTASLKSYVADEYGDRIENQWLQGGMFRCIGIDNSRQAWGKTLQEVGSRLDCDRTWLPPRTPWFKPIVEGFFGTLNKLLLQELPGFDLGRGIDHADYDPTVNACIGIRHFLYIFHKWLLDVYHVEPQEGLGGRSPNQTWLELLKNGEPGPGLLDSVDDLDSLFGVVRDGTLDHRGIRFENIRYRSDELRDFRLQSGARQRVRFKINPNDLGRVMVWHPSLKCWVRAVAAREDYARGLSLHVHKLTRQHARRLNLEDSEAGHIVGRAELQKLIADSLPMALSVAAGTKIARAIGLGTQNIFGNMDHIGRLGLPSGPFAGTPLNLWHEGTSAIPDESTSPPRTGMAPSIAPRRTSVGMEATQAPTAVPRPSRPRKTFVADDSLSKLCIK